MIFVMKYSKSIKYLLSICLTIFLFQPINLSAKPKLVVIIVVDQFRYDYLQTFYPFFTSNGFKKFSDEGINFTNCKFDFIGTVTCVGHATISTGANPRVHGIIGNAWFDGKYFPCIDYYENEESWKLTPQSLMLTTIGDELKRKFPASRVFAISGKDRASIMMGGMLSDGTYWIDYTNGKFRTSDFYKRDLPKWLVDFHNSSPFDKFFKKTWERSIHAEHYLFDDDSEFEASPTGIGNTFPRILGGGNPDSITSNFYSSMALTPHSGGVILDLAEKCIEHELLGRDDEPDLLWIGLSNIDAIGHAFGPESQEIQDSFIKTDSLLAKFMIKIENQLGIENVLFILTGDHGVAPVPEKIKNSIDAGRFSSRAFVDSMNKHLRTKFGQLKNNEKFVEISLEPNLYLNVDAILSSDLNLSLIINELKSYSKTYHEIEYFFGENDLSELSSEVREKFENNFIPGKSGQIMFSLKPFYIFKSDGVGTTHGSYHDYDTHVPFALYGSNLKPKTLGLKCSPADIAPTLAEILGFNLPGFRCGKSLIDLIK